MSKRGDEIRTFILNNVTFRPTNIAAATAGEFQITRQAVHRHLSILVDSGLIEKSGATKKTVYSLTVLASEVYHYQITPDLAEDVVYKNDIQQHLDGLPENVQVIWYHGFTEMFNNALDHSAGSRISVGVYKTATDIIIDVDDDGIGIFRKIKENLGLMDDRHAVLELSKGRVTTDPSRHTGEGIFFTSRIVDYFGIHSHEVCFGHHFEAEEDYIFKNRHAGAPGTFVTMRVSNSTRRTTTEVFDAYSEPDDFGFVKTVVPVQLAASGDDYLVSRSQAKRLLSGLNKFKTVVLDFDGVEKIGQAFADEVFRVFPGNHPGLDVQHANAKSSVRKMIKRVLSQKTSKIDPHDYGVQATLNDFSDLLVEDFNEIFKGTRTIDNLVVHPADAISFCEDVRHKRGWSSVPDNVILHLIMKARKAT